MTYNETLGFKKIKPIKDHPQLYNLLIMILGIVFGIFISIYFRMNLNERIFLSSDHSIIWLLFFYGFVWNVITHFLFKKEKERVWFYYLSPLIAIIVMICGFSLEFFFMFDNISL